MHVTDRDTDTEATPRFVGTTDLSPVLSSVTLCSHVLRQEVPGRCRCSDLPLRFWFRGGERRGSGSWWAALGTYILPAKSKPVPWGIPPRVICQPHREPLARVQEEAGGRESVKGRMDAGRSVPRGSCKSKACWSSCSRQVAGVGTVPKSSSWPVSLRLPGSCPGAGQFPGHLKLP